MFWVALIVLLGVLRQCEGGNLRRGDCGISSDVRIIISVTESYLDILSNWLVFYYRVCPDLSLIHLLCFDSGLQEPMAAYGLPCRSTFSSNTHKSVFTKRVEVAMELLDSGYDVMMTDIDAMFVKSPFWDISREISQHGADVISSRGFFPPKVGLTYGASLCMGFIHFHSSTATRVLMREFLRDAVEKKWYVECLLSLSPFNTSHILLPPPKSLLLSPIDYLT
jgi:hypothetical protein